MPTLTLSGNEITDAVRTTGVQGDGATVPGGVGVWDGTTNLVTNGGLETDTSGWTAVSAALSRITSLFKFGVACGQVVTSNLVAAEGAYATFTAAAAVHTVSAWVRGAAGGTVRMAVRDNTGANPQTGTAVTLTGTWQRITLTTTALTAATWRVYVETNVQQSITFQMDGVQAEQKPVATPYVETDGAAASRAAARVQAPSSLLTEAQGWFAARLRMGWGGAPPNAAPLVYEWWTGDGSNQISLYRVDSTSWQIDARRNGTLTTRNKVDGGLAVGDAVTLIVSWTDTTLLLSVNGSAFSSVARAGTVGGTALPSTFEIGGRDNTTTLRIDSSYRWALAGTGTLSDADAATINGYGDTAPVIGVVPGIPTFVWPGVTAAFLAGPVGNPGAVSDGLVHNVAVSDGALFNP